MIRTMLETLGVIPRPLFQFFNELDTETRTMLVSSVSFFNEVVAER
jgi:hypothetical protein